MNTQTQSDGIFLSITTLLAIGVLTGCQYCQPLLMAMIVIGTMVKGLAYSPFAKSTSADKTI